MAFATADRDALAVHITALYPELAKREETSDLKADAPAAKDGRWTVGRVVSAIVASRRKSGADPSKLDPVVAGAPPAVPPHDQEFQQYWTRWLDGDGWR